MPTDIIKNAESLSLAIEARRRGEIFQATTLPGKGKGRKPRGYMLEIDGIQHTFTTAEKNIIEEEVSKPVVSVMSEAELIENCKIAIPQLMDRAIQLAAMSDNVKDIMLVVKELTDRGYGKVVKTTDPRGEHEHVIRRGWEQFPKNDGFGYIDNEE